MDQTLNLSEGSASSSGVGSIIGQKYELIAELGRGAMGVVFKARHIALPKFFAVKILNHSLSDNLEFRARFDQEAKTSSLLNHPHLVSIYDYGSTDLGEAYLVMDFIDGLSLNDALKQFHRLDQRAAVGVFMQICDGLAHAHDLGVIHRDLKPGNVMLVSGNDGRSDFVKIVDFGIAKIAGGDGGITQSLTRTGQVLGSPLYMSPEQGHGGKLTVSTDIYSMGVLMYECLTGDPPFIGANPFATVRLHSETNAKPFAPGLRINKQLESLVMCALEKDPDNRFRSFSDMKSALANVFDPTTEPAVPVRALSSNIESKPKSKNLYSLAAVAVLVISLLGVSGFFLYHSSQPTSVALKNDGPTGITPDADSMTGKSASSTLQPRDAHLSPYEMLPILPSSLKLPESATNLSADALVQTGEQLHSKEPTSFLPALYFKTALQKNPKLVAAYDALGDFYWKRHSSHNGAESHQDLVDSNAVFSAEIAAMPDYFDGYTNRCNTSGSLGDFSQILADAAVGLRIRPADHDLHLKRGFALHELHRYQDAIDELRRYVTASDKASLYILADSYRLMNRNAEAIKCCTSWLDKTGPEAGLLMVKADCEKSLGRYREALRDFELMTRLFPSTLSARRGAMEECRAELSEHR